MFGLQNTARLVQQAARVKPNLFCLPVGSLEVHRNVPEHLLCQRVADLAGRVNRAVPLTCLGAQCTRRRRLHVIWRGLKLLRLRGRRRGPVDGVREEQVVDRGLVRGYSTVSQGGACARHRSILTSARASRRVFDSYNESRRVISRRASFLAASLRTGTSVKMMVC